MRIWGFEVFNLIIVLKPTQGLEQNNCSMLKCLTNNAFMWLYVLTFKPTRKKEGEQQARKQTSKQTSKPASQSASQLASKQASWMYCSMQHTTPHNATKPCIILIILLQIQLHQTVFNRHIYVINFAQVQWSASDWHDVQK